MDHQEATRGLRTRKHEVEDSDKIPGPFQAWKIIISQGYRALSVLSSVKPGIRVGQAVLYHQATSELNGFK